MPGPARIPGILFPLLPLYPPLGPAGPNLSAGRADVAAGGATASRWVRAHGFAPPSILTEICLFEPLRILESLVVRRESLR